MLTKYHSFLNSGSVGLLWSMFTLLTFPSSKPGNFNLISEWGPRRTFGLNPLFTLRYPVCWTARFTCGWNTCIGTQGHSRHFQLFSLTWIVIVAIVMKYLIERFFFYKISQVLFLTFWVFGLSDIRWGHLKRLSCAKALVVVVSTLGWAFNSRVWPMLLFVLVFGTAECTKWNSFEEPKTCWKQMWYYVNTALEFKNRLVLSACSANIYRWDNIGQA